MADGQDLYWWHPLVSGDPETVHDGRRLGARARQREREVDVPDEKLEDHIVAGRGSGRRGRAERAPAGKKRASADMLV